jgi:hypothetical protein
MKVLFKLGLLLVIVGAFLFAVFFVLGGSETVNGASETYEIVELSYDPSEFDTIEVDMINKAIRVFPSTTGEIEVVFYESEKNWVDIDTTDRVLKFDNDYERVFSFFFFGWFNWSQNPDYTKFDLYLPLDVIFELDLETSNGAITISNLTEVAKLTLRSSNGELLIDNVAQIASIDAYTSNGRVTLRDAIVAGLAKLRTSNGKVIVDDCTLDELDVYTSNGEIDVTMAGSQANYHIEMTTSNGSKYLNDLEIAANSINAGQSKEVTLRTSNGPIRLTFAND